MEEKLGVIRNKGLAEIDTQCKLLNAYIFKLFDIVVGENISFLQVLLRIKGLTHQTLPKGAQ